MRNAYCMPKKSDDASVRVAVAANVKYARAMLSASQEELAEQAGLHRTGVGAIERTTTSATIDSMQLLAQAVGVPTHVLLMPPRDAQPIILAAVESTALRRRR